MADILLIYTSDKKSAANQLAEAIGSAGYGLRLEQVGDVDGAAIVAQARTAGAALLVWSRPLVSSAVLDGWLDAVRRLPNLIEVSTDGIAPQAGDESRVVLLSGWRGQPFHLGWQRILEELKRLCDQRKAAPQPPPALTPTHAKEASADGGSRKGAPRRGHAFAVPAIAAAALAGAVGAATWIGTDARDTGSAVASKTTVAVERPAAATAAVMPATAVGAGEGATGASPTPASVAPKSEMKDVAEPPRTSITKKAASRILAARTAPAEPKLRRTSAARAAPAVKRYSRKHSKTMRLFCQRSGRSTPQCRTFLRSTGGVSRSAR